MPQKRSPRPSPSILPSSPREPTVDRFHRRLPGHVRSLIIKLLAEYMTTGEAATAVEKQTGYRIAPQTVRHYRDHPKWQESIERERRALAANLDRIPICSKFWRQKARMTLWEQATRDPRPDLAAARGILMDAAREMGDIRRSEAHADEQVPSLPPVQIQILNMLMQMPVEDLRRYAETGELPPPADAVQPVRHVTREGPHEPPASG